MVKSWRLHSSTREMHACNHTLTAKLQVRAAIQWCIFFLDKKKYIDCFDKLVDVCVIHLEWLHLHTRKQKNSCWWNIFALQDDTAVFLCLPFQTLLPLSLLLAQQWPHLFCLDQRCCPPALLGRFWGRGQESLLQEYRNDRLSQSCGGQIKTEGGGGRQAQLTERSKKGLIGPYWELSL